MSKPIIRAQVCIHHDEDPVLTEILASLTIHASIFARSMSATLLK